MTNLPKLKMGKADKMSKWICPCCHKWYFRKINKYTWNGIQYCSLECSNEASEYADTYDAIVDENDEND